MREGSGVARSGSLRAQGALLRVGQTVSVTLLRCGGTSGLKPRRSASTLAVADEFRRRGAQVFVAAPGLRGAGMLPVASGLPALCTPLLIIQSFYRAASALALRRGFNPDVPPHLNKVTETV